MPDKRRKYEVRTTGEPGSTTAVEFSTSKDDLPLISESVKLMIKPLFEALPPERRTVTNLQDALDLAKEGWNLQIELGDDREGLSEASRPGPLARRGARPPCQPSDLARSVQVQGRLDSRSPHAGAAGVTRIAFLACHCSEPRQGLPDLEATSGFALR